MGDKTYLVTAWLIFAFVFILKIILGVGYRSTDFEVHRNWLAITHSLPISQWYFDETSPWTLDYPPFFAYFECTLSYFAQLFDSNMLKVGNLGYDSVGTVLFQRATVIAADIVLLLGAYRFVITILPLKFSKTNSEGQEEPDTNRSEQLLSKKRTAILILILINVGLLMVDHIHFQYNGMLLGILLLSLAALNGDHPLESAFWFAVLLNFKHIYLYIAPIYVVYLLRVYCLGEGSAWWDLRRLRIVNVLKLALVLLLVFGISLGPFIYMDQIPQLISRLFPFKRGLAHAYWAPNAWALYLFFDLIIAKILGIRSGTPGATSGLVGASNTLVLPDVPPVLTLLLTIAFMLPLLAKVWEKPTKATFLKALVPISLCSFFFGWHVHEKAILLTIIPATLVAFEDYEWAQVLTRLVWVGHFSLFPLFLNQFSVSWLYVMLFGYWFIVVRFVSAYLGNLERVTGDQSQNKLVTVEDVVAVFSLLGVALLNEFLLPFFAPHYEFLPLLLTSVYSAYYIARIFKASFALTLKI